MRYRGAEKPRCLSSEGDSEAADPDVVDGHPAACAAGADRLGDVDGREHGGGDGEHARDGGVVVRLDAIRVDALQVVERLDALLPQLCGKATDEIERAHQTFVRHDGNRLSRQLGGDAQLATKVEAQLCAFDNAVCIVVLGE